MLQLAFTGAKAQHILERLRGAAAPLFHGQSSFRCSSKNFKVPALFRKGRESKDGAPGVLNLLRCLLGHWLFGRRLFLGNFRFVGGVRGFRLFHQVRESCRVFYCQVGEDFAVEVDAR